MLLKIIAFGLLSSTAFADQPACNTPNSIARYCTMTPMYNDASRYAVEVFILNPKDGSTAQSRTIAPNLSEAQALDLLKSAICN